MASRVDDELLARAAHELRTHTAAMAMWLPALRSADGQERERAASALETAVRMQARLVDDLHELARLGVGKVTLRRAAVDVREVIQRSLLVLEPTADRARVALERSFVDAPLPRVSGDAARLEQVVTNLLANAIRCTPAGGRVHVAVEVRDAVVVLSVADTGCGIADEILPRIFEPFAQGENERVGLGLGLAIVREIVALHGGTIAAASDGPGRGATFTVELPRLASRSDAPAAGATSGAGQ